MRVVEQVLAAEGDAHRKAVRLGEGAHVGAGIGAPARPAENRERARGGGELGSQRRHVGGARPRPHRFVGAAVGDRRGVAQHVFRQGDDDRALAPRRGGAEGMVDQLGDAPGVVDLQRQLGDRALEHLPVVDLLEPLAAGGVARDLAHEQHHRRRILHRRVDADRGVAGAGAAGDEAHARAPGRLAPGLRHVGGAALLAAGDDRDPVARAVQRVERREIAFAGHAEHRVDAVETQRVHEDFAARPRRRTVAHPPLLRRRPAQPPAGVPPFSASADYRRGAGAFNKCRGTGRHDRAVAGRRGSGARQVLHGRGNHVRRRGTRARLLRLTAYGWPVRTGPAPRLRCGPLVQLGRHASPVEGRTPGLPTSSQASRERR